MLLGASVQLWLWSTLDQSASGIHVPQPAHTLLAELRKYRSLRLVWLRVEKMEMDSGSNPATCTTVQPRGRRCEHEVPVALIVQCALGGASWKSPAGPLAEQRRRGAARCSPAPPRAPSAAGPHPQTQSPPTPESLQLGKGRCTGMRVAAAVCTATSGDGKRAQAAATNNRRRGIHSPSVSNLSSCSFVSMLQSRPGARSRERAERACRNGGLGEAVGRLDHVRSPSASAGLRPQASQTFARLTGRLHDAQGEFLGAALCGQHHWKLIYTCKGPDGPSQLPTARSPFILPSGQRNPSGPPPAA